MKTITTITNLIEKAKERAEKRNGDIRMGIAQVSRKVVGRVKYDTPQEVYRVEYLDGGLTGASVELWHLGTKTAEVWLADTPQVMHIYGESRSDADSVNTFLAHFGIAERYTYKPVNGGFQEVE